MEVIKWIRPDWKDAGQYTDHGADLYMWYWEFLRRREDYQQDFYQHALETYELYCEVYSNLEFFKEQKLTVLTPNERGFTASIPDAYSKYLIAHCPNPAIDSPNPAIDSPRYFYYRSCNSIVAGKIGSEYEEKIVTYLSGNEMLFKFDLSMPIDAQLATAKEMFARDQKLYLYKKTGDENPKLIQRRAHTSKWVSYLRALDAVHAGATLEEIGRCIEQMGDDDDRLEKRVGQKLVNAAKEVQFNFPF